LEEWIEQGYFTFDVTRIDNGLLDTRYKIKVVLKIQAVPVAFTTVTCVVKHWKEVSRDEELRI
jgi:hypothetical protein